MSLRVLVCGGRSYDDARHLALVLSRLSPSVVIHGAARGADTLAGEWARANGILELPFPADWDRLGRQAGPARNAQMLKEGVPDLVLAFRGGRGTHDMTRRAREAGVPVLTVGAP